MGSRYCSNFSKGMVARDVPRRLGLRSIPEATGTTRLVLILVLDKSAYPNPYSSRLALASSDDVTCCDGVSISIEFSPEASEVERDEGGSSVRLSMTSTLAQHPTVLAVATIFFQRSISCSSEYDDGSSTRVRSERPKDWTEPSEFKRTRTWARTRLSSTFGGAEGLLFSLSADFSFPFSSSFLVASPVPLLSSLDFLPSALSAAASPSFLAEASDETPNP
mmetsp:Transcript_13626/g.39064  ORF Transcript_13626/g.39064 Transcript_13626/m.39064 type:complete len:221 (-) Transcript_13626:326-988(-)